MNKYAVIGFDVATTCRKTAWKVGTADRYGGCIAISLSDVVLLKMVSYAGAENLLLKHSKIPKSVLAPDNKLKLISGSMIIVF